LVDVFLSSDVSSFDPTLLRMLRFLRLTKIFRLFKVLQFFAELRLLLKCIAGSFPALLWSVIMLTSTAALVATIIVQQLSAFLRSEAGATLSSMALSELLTEFGSIQLATLSLLKAISGGNDWDAYFQLLGIVGFPSQVVFLIFVVFAWLSLTNIITSLFVDQVMKLAQPDLDQMLVERRKEDLANAEELRDLFDNLDKNHDGSLSFHEFQACMQDVDVVHYCQMKGLEITDAELCFKMLQDAAQNAEVDIDTFIGGFMKMKGMALNIDLMSLQYQIRVTSETQQNSIKQAIEEVHQLSTALHTVLESLRVSGRHPPKIRPVWRYACNVSI